jgi:glycolate oxidase subunit GlcD
MSNINILETSLRAQLPAHLILTDAESCAFYGRDWIKDFEPKASMVVLPESIEQIQAIVRSCIEAKVAIVPSGGRTGLSGGATATKGEVVVSLERMRRVLEVNRVDRTIRCEAGVALERIQIAAAEQGLYFPVDFSSRGSSQIGGNIATNAGGIRVIKYGNVRDWVVGLKVVAGTGEILELNGSLFKNNCGYDLRSLVIGSEGTLGIIAEATLRLASPPKDTTRVLCGLSGNDAILPLLSYCRDNLRGLSAFEFMEKSAVQEVIARRGLRNPFTNTYPTYILVEIELNEPNASDEVVRVFGEAFENGMIQDVVVSESTAQSKELMDLRDLISETLSTHYSIHKNDISVPVAAIPNFVNDLHASITAAYPDFKVVVFGHVGDGNLHVNVLKPTNMGDGEFWEKCHQADHTVFATVQRYKGSVSAEHGVGLLKRAFIHYTRSEAELHLMRGIKRVFDPHDIMNPGKILPIA